MDRREFFKTTTLAGLATLIVPASLLKSRLEVEIDYVRRIIYVSRPPNEIATKELHDVMMSIWDHERVHSFEKLNSLGYMENREHKGVWGQINEHIWRNPEEFDTYFEDNE